MHTYDTHSSISEQFWQILYMIVAIDDEQAKDIIASSAMYKITYIHKIIKSTVLKMYY